MKLTDTAVTILERRYVRKDAEGKPIETAYELFDRVATAIAAVEQRYGSSDVEGWKERYYNLMTSMSFLPNSPTLMNAGTEDGQLSACFVLPIEDSMSGIFNTLRDAVLIHKTGGGTGFSFSRIRPSASIVKSTGGVASGPVSFMKPYDAATDTVKQGGKRRGANMGTLRVDHPNIMEFITCKRDKKSFTNFNISVGITDKFMDALFTSQNYDLINPMDGSVAGQLSAIEVWNTIVDCAWETGEPGILFIDRINRFNPTPELGLFEATNPCGEQPLLPYESCNLGSMNLLRYYDSSVTSGPIPGFDMLQFKKDIYTAVRFLDNVIDANKYPLEKITEATLATRKIGLGVMGFADLLYSLGIPYDSEQGVEVGMNIMRVLTDTARDASRMLGAERGNFPAKDKSIWKDEPFMRHAAVTTIAPTGTISMIADVSSGIEPVFGLAYIKNVMDDDKFVTLNKVLAAKVKLTDEQAKELARVGSLKRIPNIPEETKRIFVSAHDISPEWHINMQAAFQTYTDNAISKTINFPKDATAHDIGRGYLHAWETGCKGTTVYRDGSLDGQTITFGTAEPRVAKADSVVPRERGKTTRGFTDKVNTGCGNLYVTVNFDDYGICEVFTHTGKGGGCASQSESAARLATLALRADVDHGSIVRQIKGIRCPAAVKNPNSECLSCPDAIAKTIQRASAMLGEGTHLELAAIEETAVKAMVEQNGTPCPDCSTMLSFGEGCVLCPNCGYSKCN